MEEEVATHSSSSCLENPTGGEAWRATVHVVAKSWTGPSDWPWAD